MRRLLRAPPSGSARLIFLSILSILAALVGSVGLLACGSGADVHRASPLAPASAHATIRVGVGPTAVAVGAGSVWVANTTAGTITRIDPLSHTVIGKPIAVGNGPRAIAVGEGGVWVADGDGVIARINPQTERVTKAATVVDPVGVAVGEGSVWVTSRSTASVVRLDPATAKTVGPPISVGAGPTDVGVDKRGAWVANSGDGTVSRIDPRTLHAQKPIVVAKHHPLKPGSRLPPVPQPGAEVLGLALAQDGVWIAKTDDLETAKIEVVRIDPDSATVSGTPVTVRGAIPMRLAAAAGSIWVTDTGSKLPPGPARPAALQRIDAKAHALSGGSTPVGNGPTGAAVGLGGVWIANSADNTVTEVSAAGCCG